MTCDSCAAGVMSQPLTANQQQSHQTLSSTTTEKQTNLNTSIGNYLRIFIYGYSFTDIHLSVTIYLPVFIYRYMFTGIYSPVFFTSIYSQVFIYRYLFTI